MAYTFVGQLCSIRGNECWYSVGWKYYMFWALCFGVWTEASYNALSFPDRYIEMVNGPATGDMSTLLAGDLTLKETYLNGVAAVLGPRSILFEVIPSPYFTIMSIYTLQMASSPLYLCDKFSRDADAYTSAFSVAGVCDEKVTSDGSSTKEEFWKSFLRCFCNLSARRYIKLPYNFFLFLVTLGIALMPVSFWEGKTKVFLVSVVIFLYNALMSINYVLAFGKSLQVTNKDISDNFIYCLFAGVADERNKDGQSGSDNTTTIAASATILNPMTTIHNPVSGIDIKIES